MKFAHVSRWASVALIIALVFALAIGCSQDDGTAYRNNTAEVASLDYELGETNGGGAVSAKMASFESDQVESVEIIPHATNIERKLIKTGYVEFETPDLTATREQIFQAVQQYGGYISSDQEYSYYDTTHQTITIRVPAEHFDSLLIDVTKGVDKLDSKQVSVRDVTEEFLDVKARISTKKELESRYLEILQQATTVEEMLEVERELGTLRADIESLEGRLQYLANQVSLSTLTIDFYQTVPVGESKVGYGFVNALKNGWKNFMEFFLLLANIWPFLLIALTAVIIAVASGKKHKKRVAKGRGPGADAGEQDSVPPAEIDG